MNYLNFYQIKLIKLPMLQVFEKNYFEVTLPEMSQFAHFNYFNELL